MVDAKTIYHIAQLEINIDKIKRTQHIEASLERAKHIILIGEQSEKSEALPEEFKTALFSAMVRRRRI